MHAHRPFYFPLRLQVFASFFVRLHLFFDVSYLFGPLALAPGSRGLYILSCMWFLMHVYHPFSFPCALRYLRASCRPLIALVLGLLLFDMGYLSAICPRRSCLLCQGMLI